MEMQLGCCCQRVEGLVCGFATCCRDTIVPRRAWLTVGNPGGGSYLCRSLYYGVFDMRNKFATEVCYIMRSEEKIILADAFCTPGGPSAIGRYRVEYLSFPSVIRVEAFSPVAATGGTTSGASGRWQYAGPDIQCLSEIVLAKVSTDNAAFPMPLTVTLTPY